MSRNTCCGGCQDPVPNSLPDVECRTLLQGIIRYEAVGTSWVGTIDYSTGYSEGSRASLKCKKKKKIIILLILPSQPYHFLPVDPLFTIGRNNNVCQLSDKKFRPRCGVQMLTVVTITFKTVSYCLAWHLQDTITWPLLATWFARWFWSTIKQTIQREC